MSGTLDLDLVRLYKAGREEMPDEAERISSIAHDLHDALTALDSQTAAAGDPPALRNLLQVGGDIFDELRQTVDDLNNMAVAATLTADHLDRADGDAQQRFQTREELLGSLPAPATVPADIGDVEDPGATDGAGNSTPSTPDPFGGVAGDEHDHDDHDGFGGPR